MTFKNVGGIHVHIPNALDVKVGKVVLWDRILNLNLSVIFTNTYLAYLACLAKWRDHAFAFASWSSIVRVPSCSRSISNAR